jgi:hypothetical protein
VTETFLSPVCAAETGWTMTRSRGGGLARIKVTDLMRAVARPQMLAAHDAEGIKVEPPQREEARA